MPRRDTCCIWDNLKKVYRIECPGGFLTLVWLCFPSVEEGCAAQLARKSSSARRTKSGRVPRVSPEPTEPRSFGEGGGWLEGSISESFSHPHSPVRHGSERTSWQPWPDNFKLGRDPSLFFVAPLNGIWWILYREPVTGMWLCWDDRGVPSRPPNSRF